MPDTLPPAFRSPDDRIKRLHDIVEKSNGFWTRFGDFFFTILWVSALTFAMVILGENLWASWRPARYSVMGGPADGEYRVLANNMQQAFNGAKPGSKPKASSDPDQQPIWRHRPQNLGEQLKRMLLDPERSLTMDWSRKYGQDSPGSEKNMTEIASDPYTIGFCQDGDFSDDATKPLSDKLRALAPAYTSNLYIFVKRSRSDKSPEFNELAAYMHRHMGSDGKFTGTGIGFVSEATRAAFEEVAEQYGVMVPKTLNSEPGKKGLDEVLSGDKKAFVALLGPKSELFNGPAEGPGSNDRPSVIPRGLDLVEIDRAQGVVTRKNGYRAESIAIGALNANGDELPTRSVSTIGVKEILACNADLPDRDAFDIVQRLDQIPGLKSSLTNLDNAWKLPESATYIPMHPGALTYFRKQELPQAFDPTVYAFLGTAAGAYFTRLKRHRLRPHLKEVEELVVALLAETTGQTPAKGWRKLVAKVRAWRPLRKRKPGPVLDLDTVRYEAWVKLKLGLIDDSHYSCLEKYCTFVESLREYGLSDPRVPVNKIVKNLEELERDKERLKSSGESPTVL